MCQEGQIEERSVVCESYVGHLVIAIDEESFMNPVPSTEAIAQ